MQSWPNDMRVFALFFVLVTSIIADDRFHYIRDDFDRQVMNPSSKEARNEYIKSIPPESMKVIVDKLGMDFYPLGTRDIYFGVVLYKAKEFEQQGIGYDGDYVFEKAVGYARSEIKKELNYGSTFMNKFRGLHHPLVLKLADELLHSEDEVTVRNAKVYLKGYEETKKRAAQQERRKNRSHPREEGSNLANSQSQSASPDSENAAVSVASRIAKWPIMLAIVLVLGGIFLWLRAKARKRPVATRLKTLAKWHPSC